MPVQKQINKHSCFDSLKNYFVFGVASTSNYTYHQGINILPRMRLLKVKNNVVSEGNAKKGNKNALGN